MCHKLAAWHRVGTMGSSGALGQVGQGLGGATGEEAWHCTDTRPRAADSIAWGGLWGSGQVLQSFPPCKASYNLTGVGRFLGSLPLHA